MLTYLPQIAKAENLSSSLKELEGVSWRSGQRLG